MIEKHYKVYFSQDCNIPRWNSTGFYRFTEVYDEEKADILISNGNNNSINGIQVICSDIIKTQFSPDPSRFIYFPAGLTPFLLESRLLYRNSDRNKGIHWTIPRYPKGHTKNEICGIISIVSGNSPLEGFNLSMELSSKEFTCSFYSSEQMYHLDFHNQSGLNIPLPEGDGEYYFWLDLWESLCEQRGSSLISPEWFRKTHENKEYLYG